MAGMQIDPAHLDLRAIYRLMTSVVVPRPIAWVSTLSPDGITNAAPFSYFQALGGKPPTILIAVGNRRDGEPKDTRRNIEATGEFVVNIVDEKAGPAMVQTSIDYPYGTSEFDEAGLSAVPSERVAPPRIGECEVSLECKLDRVLEIAGSGVCIGEVVLFHVADHLLDADGQVDPVLLGPIGRMGANSYMPLCELNSIDQTGDVRMLHSINLELFRDLRRSSIEMVGMLSVEQLAAGSGRIFLRMAGSREHSHDWDESWTAERIAAEMVAAGDPQSCAVEMSICRESWYQGQAALLHGDEFPESNLWRM